jgi:glycosyltransferase involved in cell wall biosynthesis
LPLHDRLRAVTAFVSVVIPCYNHGRFLGAAIESVLGQGRCRPEVVVVDDGSSDDTARVAARYGGVRCVRRRNQGLAAARNAGLDATHAPYVVFLDADDRLLPGALVVGAAALEARPDAGFAVGRHRRIAVDGRPLPLRPHPRVDGDHYASLIRRCWIAMPATVMHRRTALDAVGRFDPALRHAEDYDLYLRVAARFPIVDHHTEVAEYRQHAGTLSREAAPMLRATLTVLRRHRPDARASPAHRAAWHARENAVWYYDRVLDGVVDALQRRQLATAARRLGVFVWYLPQHPPYAARRLGTPIRLARQVAAPS